MGLDVLTYNKKSNRIEVFEISQDLHYRMFNEINLDTGGFTKIIEITDYYKTNIQLSGETLKEFIVELRKIKNVLSFNEEIDFILSKIDLENVYMIRITGD